MDRLHDPAILTQVYNRASGLHEAEGAYVGSYEVAPHQLMHDQRCDAMALGIVPNRPTQVIELIFTGSPIGKRDALDDASQDLTLLIQDEDECLSSVLDRHVAAYSRPQWRESAVLSPLPIEIRCMTAAIAALARVLLYLNLPEAEQRRVAERSDLDGRLRVLGPKKAAKLGRKLATAYDRILIGPTVAPRALQTDSLWRRVERESAGVDSAGAGECGGADGR